MSPSPRQRRSRGEPGRPAAIAVSMGDPKGIGPDITLMSWRERQRDALPSFLVYGDPDGQGAPAPSSRFHGDPQALVARARAWGLEVPNKTLARPAEAAEVFSDALPVWPVQVSALGEDRAIVAAIETAVAAVCGGEALAIVTNPIVKRTLDRVELPYPGHTEFLADLALRHGTAARPMPVMMLVAEELKAV